MWGREKAFKILVEEFPKYPCGKIENRITDEH
jgi:hypothetical protein